VPSFYHTIWFCARTTYCFTPENFSAVKRLPTYGINSHVASRRSNLLLCGDATRYDERRIVARQIACTVSIGIPAHQTFRVDVGVEECFAK